MMSLFLNPWTFIAGALLVSVPIIIHLINRIRFRRVKWAAMEFLLKAQKRMRRRKILEQLLLLLMRCLLVFLVGVLFARYLGGCGGSGKGQETRPTTHVIILDDTPSMADAAPRGEGAPAADAYAEAKKLIYEKLMPAAAEATTTQTVQVLFVSGVSEGFPAQTEVNAEKKTVPRSPEKIREEGRVNATNIELLKEYLEHPDRRQVATVRRSLRNALDKAAVIAERAPATDSKVIHIVGDLRNPDWTEDGQSISDKLTELKDNGVTVHLIDVANPARKPDRKSPQFSDNIAILEVKPRNRVVAVDQQTEIDVRVKNFGSVDLKDVRVQFFLNGQGNKIQSLPFPSLPANQERTLPVTVTFTQTGSREKPLDRFNLVTAHLATADPGGIVADNVRHAVVEVRPKLQVLVVEGRPELRESPRGDSFYLKKFLLQGLGGVEWVTTEAPKLDATDLRPFSSIYLLNVPTLSDAAVKNLERYVGDGGGVGVFLGPDVKPDDYNAKMYRAGTGFFPVPLPATGFTKELTREQAEARANAFGKRLFLRSAAMRGHPALSIIYDDRLGKAKENDIEPFFYFTNIDNHWPIARGGALRDDKSVQELYCMPNETPIGEFEGPSRDLVIEIKKKYGDAKFEKARKFLDPLLQKIFDTPATPGNSLSEQARYLDQLLCDQINDGDESEPVLRAFWNEPELAETKATAMQLRDRTKYGDPLYLAKQFGRGRVTLMTTDAGGTYGGKTWTDWPSGKGHPSWVPIVLGMQGYLSGGGGDTNLSLGERYFQEFEPGTRENKRYKPEVGRHLLTIDVAKVNNAVAVYEPKSLGNQPLDQPANPTDAPPDAPPRPFQLAYSDAKAAGVYVFSLTRLKGDKDPPGTPAEQPDYAAVAFNVDAAREGDLRRANTDDLGTWTNKAPLHNTEDLSWIDDFKQKPTDLSSRRWLYLLILLLLIAEQAWAVRISYHTRPEDLEALAPSAAAAFAHHTTVTPASADTSAADANAATAAR